MSEMRPIDKIEKAVQKRVYIKLKGRNHGIKAILKSFDEHLNLFLEETVELSRKFDPEQNKVVKVETELDSIILRGDNVVLLTLDDYPSVAHPVSDVPLDGA